MKKRVLLVSIAFSPNIGGIETHFDDLVFALSKRGWMVDVITYKPITTDIAAKIVERKNSKVRIIRIPWFRGLFYKLVDNPLLEFIYLFPGLFIIVPTYLLFNKKINVIHSHGLVAGAVSVFWGRLFGKRVVTTTHSIYHFPEIGLYRIFAKWVFSTSDKVLTLSKQSKKEIISLGVHKSKVKKFTYWINLDLFKPVIGAKTEIGMKDKFIVFCASRLVPEKGIRELLKAAEKWNKRINLIIANDGTLKSLVQKYADKLSNIFYVGNLTQNEIVPYYSAADLVIVPSTHEEGFGRVILESLACGTPVIGANRGAIPEAMDETVGRLIEVTPKNIKDSVEFFYRNPDKLKRLSKNARKFAEKRYSEKNLDVIISAYKDGQTKKKEIRN